MIPTDSLVNAIRFLSIDAVEKAQSGHPGMPLGMADVAAVLWMNHLNHHPKNPNWFNRDRFVLSNGHGSMLLYSLLHLSGYPLSIDDIKAFRQLHSKTPGHPEIIDTKGVETTTGPLGQGLANAVGMALAEKILAARFNRPGYTLVDHHTYVFVGDGCLMEGISHEACSLAGTLNLNKLVVFYDDNGISIDGEVAPWFNEDVPQRFKAYHWDVISIDGHDRNAIDKAIIQAKNNTKPTLIRAKTHIGFGSPAADSESCHGAPLGKDAIAKTRETLKWPYPPFEIPEDIYQSWNAADKGDTLETEWLKLLADYKKAFPDAYYAFLREINGDLPDDWATFALSLEEKALSQEKPMATRKASQWVLEAISPKLPELFGGSADLTGSNNTDWSKTVPVTVDNIHGNYLHYGVREFGMSAMMNGIALHGGLIPYGGTFLVFSDYARNAIRLSALMRIRVIYVLTHDSIALGEDGPTHQPIEHAAMLRMTPGMHVYRPASLLETTVCWTSAIERFHGPSALLLSRQNLPVISHESHHIEGIKKGGYILSDSKQTPDAIIIATGSEVPLAISVKKAIEAESSWNIRVVSMPCVEAFLAQPESYQNDVLPNHIRKRLVIEAGSTHYWYRFAGLDGRIAGIDTFGLSAKGEDVYDYFGFNLPSLMKTLYALLDSETHL